MKARYLIIIERGAPNYSAYSPDLPGCIATGKSVEETIEQMRGAIEFHLEGMAESGEEIPKPRNLQFYVQETGEISENDLLTTIETNVPEMVHA